MVRKSNYGAYSSLSTGRAYYPNRRNQSAYRRYAGYGQRRPSGGYGSFGRSFSRGVQGKGQDLRLFAPMTWIVGAIAGLSDIDNKIPAVAKVGLATAPVTGKLGGKAKQFAQGMCFGDLLQKQLLPMLGIKIGGNTGGASGNGVNQI